MQLKTQHRMTRAESPFLRYSRVDQLTICVKQVASVFSLRPMVIVVAAVQSEMVVISPIE